VDPNTKEFVVDSVPLPRNMGLVPGGGDGRSGPDRRRPADDRGTGRLLRLAVRRPAELAAGGPDIYPGWFDADFNVAVPTFGTDEGSLSYYGYPEMHGPQRGDNMCPVLDFPYTSPDVAGSGRQYRRALLQGHLG